ncbi:MAG TPA: gamma-glutamyl-gamma-aminobutyrate hydrolase family protein [Streptosporangiaceae bacterium]|nr:gamma-glutamyl-gamma-aminobutyrate hydrolase family protein [Streptosporangiaceae bacterium]
MAEVIMRPLIGISTYNDLAQWRDWNAPAALIPQTYVNAVRRSGGRPVLLPPGGDPAEAAATVADLDGLIVSGGGDVDPARYGAAPHPETGAPNRERDGWELALLDAALAHAVPLLAVCRGIQLLNVVRGGTLHQHLPQVVGNDGHSGPDCGFGRHLVRIGSAGTLGRVLGRAGDEDAWLDAPTHHHQAVDRLGDGLVATAWAADGTVEGLEVDGGRGFAVGVQWHPEEGDDPRLFEALVAAATEVADGAGVLGGAGQLGVAVSLSAVYSWSITQPESPLHPAGRQPRRAGRIVRHHRRGVPPGADRQRLRGDGGTPAGRDQAGRAWLR